MIIFVLTNNLKQLIMISKVFTKDTLEINCSRNRDNSITLGISSDYSDNQHKGRLWVNEKSVAVYVEQAWKSIKSKKLQSMILSFDEIDYYDNETDVYYTPRISIRRGNKKASLSQNSHGSIPKDWSVQVDCNIADTTTKSVIIDTLKNVLGYKFTTQIEKEITKKLKPFLQKKETRFSYYNEED